MKIQWNKVTWYSKLIAATLLILFPLIGFFAGVWYQKAISPTQTVETEKVYDQEKQEDKNITDNNRNRSCGKSTIIIYTLSISLDEAEKYFTKYGLTLVDNTTGGYLVDVGVGGDTHWINKLKADGIGNAVYDMIGCDFID